MILLVTLLLMPAPADGKTDEVARFGCAPGRPVALKNVGEVQAAYARRSIAIIDAGLERQTVRLRAMVAPAATFALFDGDEGASPRSTGAEAAVEFAGYLNPSDFQVELPVAGPVAIDPCAEIVAEVRLGGGESDRARRIIFSYRGGMLIGAIGRDVTLVSGDFHAAGAR